MADVVYVVAHDSDRDGMPDLAGYVNLADAVDAAKSIVETYRDDFDENTDIDETLYEPKIIYSFDVDDMFHVWVEAIVVNQIKEKKE